MSALKRLGIKISDLHKLEHISDEQSQTKDTFCFKWSKRDTYESDAVKAKAQAWLFERYCKNDPTRIEKWLSGGRKIILDAGCGSGFSALLFFGHHLEAHDYLGVDISDAIEIAKQRFEESGYPGDFLKMDLVDIPVSDELIDMIFSEGVLHHTDSTEKTLKFLAKKLRRGGRFLFYVYAKKAAVREFTDDYVRNQLKNLSDEEAWKALESLTKLGIELGKMNIKINISEDIPLLGIKKGEIDLHRFFYWNICKLYYDPEFALQEMNHINFDWFRPLNCHRQTPAQVKQWCIEAGLTIEHMNVQESGITVVAVRQ